MTLHLLAINLSGYAAGKRHLQFSVHKKLDPSSLFCFLFKLVRTRIILKLLNLIQHILYLNYHNIHVLSYYCKLFMLVRTRIFLTFNGFAKLINIIQHVLYLIDHTMYYQIIASDYIIVST